MTLNPAKLAQFLRRHGVTERLRLTIETCLGPPGDMPRAADNTIAGPDTKKISVEQVLKWSVLVFGLLYGIGLFAVRRSSAAWSVDDFEIVKVEYVLTGVLYLVVVLLPAAVVGLPLLAVRFRTDRSRLRRFFMLVTLSGIASLFASCLLVTVVDCSNLPCFSGSQGKPVSAVSMLLRPWRIYYPCEYGWVMLLPMVLLYFTAAVTWLRWRRMAPLVVRRARVACNGTIVAMAGFWMLIQFSELQYPYLQIAYGGGGRARCNLVLKDDAVKALNLLHLPKTQDGVLREVLVVGETDKHVYFLVDPEVRFVIPMLYNPHSVIRRSLYRVDVYRLPQADVVVKVRSAEAVKLEESTAVQGSPQDKGQKGKK